MRYASRTETKKLQVDEIEKKNKYDPKETNGLAVFAVVVCCRRRSARKTMQRDLSAPRTYTYKGSKDINKQTAFCTN